ncbi:hypothetical protein N7474_004145 [Penicillium riverlandense]|uniref:uncharacterized protein n=1 Tax=Penicillium riverlandense TaxID=1903569 RepID=UPI0025494B6D|nr:uncharacterized protein N7474_004145 [Penicillium riverlandense]KAJ5818554.1 hypothetical protein N7474_004145 [Penicillium riverlandense]
MRSFVAALLIAGAAAQSTSDYAACAEAILDNTDPSQFSDCSDLTSAECFCANKDVIDAIGNDIAETCSGSGITFDDLSGSLCKSDNAETGDRHASKPMEPVNHKRAFAPEASAEVRVVTVTETQCSCASTQRAMMPGVSQIPIDIPASSSRANPSSSMGLMSSSSGLFGSHSATPTPSGASASRFNAFQGAAPAGSAVHGGVAALGVAAVMALMVAL